MPASRPTPLFENAGFAFLGENPWPAARLTARQAKSLTSAQNPSGRSNADVLRNFIGSTAGQITEQTQIDFPLHFTEQEAALYQKPFKQLGAAQKAGGSTVGASLLATPGLRSREQARSHKFNPAALTEPTWWLNPHANSELRTALARLERYLATPLNAKTPQWHWINSHLLPDATLLAVARDDDFAHGLLQSRCFACWGRQLAAQLSPTEIIASFPFPWALGTLLSALTRTQEDHRYAIARAARADNPDQINSTVAAAYGWPLDLSDDEILTQLMKLNHERIPVRLARM